MKKYIVAISICLFVCAFGFANLIQLASNSDLAHVQKINGLNVFILSRPENKFETLGKVKIRLTWSNEPEALFKELQKKVAREYPGANGIIIKSIALDEAEAIMFEN